MDPVLEGYRALLEKVKQYHPGVSASRLFDAFTYADEAHSTQRRKDGSPFVSHPLAAAQIVAEMGLDPDCVIAALLHDCIEDTGTTYAEIAARFGATVADLVDGVTKLTRVPFSSKEDEQMENLRKMLLAMAKDIRVILIKIADRLHNMQTMNYQTVEKQREKALETMEIYAPIAHRLGMQKMKWALEDLSLQYLDPVGYAEISEELLRRSNVNEEFMNFIKAKIQNRLEEAGIQGEVHGRIKHIYSIYRKMYSQNRTMDEIYDLYAARVIVGDVADCYNVLGCIHELFRPVLGRFKDHIGTPKPNGYQSLHTTVIGREGIPFEVQIRTEEMHRTAEYGVAAHWKYKQGIQGKLGVESTFEWVRRLLETQQDTDPEEFVHRMKVDLFSDEVFVFTPRGDVINLPAGSTPIDFAYNIHSGVGNAMIGAKVNGRIVPFEYTLKNGDIAEILTSKTAHGPSRDWMQLARSNEARYKIRQWFKRERREENVAHGKMSLESELRRAGIPLSAVTGEEILPAVLKRLAVRNLDDLYAMVGYGGITALKATGRIRDELFRQGRLQSGRDTGEKRPELANEAIGGGTTIGRHPERREPAPQSGVIVAGLDNCLIKFARCCTPVPGDPIAGFITRGYGVSIHRQDCPNAQRGRERAENEGRWVDAHWAGTPPESYQTALDLTGRNRDELVLDVTQALSALKVTVQAVFARGTPDGGALIHLDLEVRDREQLKTVMTRLHQISGIHQVHRSAG